MNKNSTNALYLAGAIAPLITLVFYFCNLVFIPYDVYPKSVADWYALFDENALKALFYLNSLDIISVAALGVMFLALYQLLKNYSKPLLTISTPFAFLGIAIFIVPRTMLMNMYSLSRQFNAAQTAAEQQQLLAAGRAFNAAGLPTLHTAGFFIIAFAALLVSISLIKSGKGILAGIIGILGFVFTVVDDISLLYFPKTSTTLLVISGSVWVVWWLVISLLLFRSSKQNTKTVIT